MSRHYPIENSFTVGATLGYWTIISEPLRVRSGSRMLKRWPCRCKCGKVRNVTRQVLANSGNTGCGYCSPRGILKHTWKLMLYRCFNPKAGGYHRYGGRGITVCDEWRKSFQAFAEHVGERPSSDHQLDRINNDGNYQPGNVRWATRVENVRNSTAVRKVLVGGSETCVSELAEQAGVRNAVVLSRLNLGWDSNEIIAAGSRRTQTTRARKFNDDELAAIRRKLNSGIEDATIAREMNCSPNTIGRIKRGLTYRVDVAGSDMFVTDRMTVPERKVAADERRRA